jgi:quercetin dioxygenase-like cupin family protein
MTPVLATLSVAPCLTSINRRKAMKRIVTLSILGSLGILVALMSAPAAQATAPVGSGGTLYRATLDPYRFKSGDFKIVQKKQEDVVMRQIFIDPGGNNGWHFHPGPTFVVVVQGTISLYEANDPTCTPTRYSAGSGFVETPGDVHIARNEGTVQVIAEVTFLDVPVGGAFRLDAPSPGTCPFDNPASGQGDARP